MQLVAVPPTWSAIVRIVAEYDERDLRAMLTDSEVAELASSRVESRHRERAASRIAAKSLALDRAIVDRAAAIGFAKEEARPLVTINGAGSVLRVSFSHSAGLGGAALHDSPVGFDLERERAIDPRATKFFLRGEELDAARSAALPNALLHWWCAKEAAFKLGAGHATLLRVPLALEGETPAGLVLRGPRDSRVETVRLGPSLVAALAIG